MRTKLTLFAAVILSLMFFTVSFVFLRTLNFVALHTSDSIAAQEKHDLTVLALVTLLLASSALALVGFVTWKYRAAQSESNPSGQ